ncbi:MAG: serine/threonine protein kinase [Ideonella sp.]|nr:serine/threonine protein kinase [Ideonella sp.]
MSADHGSGGEVRAGARPLHLQPDVDLGGNAPTVGNKLSVGLRLDEYEISGVIGEGGFGIVYLAWDHSLQRRLAIKEYMPASLARRTSGLPVEVRSPEDAESFQAGLRSFINEAKLLARFDHPALLKVHRFWQANGTAYMVMPYYEGPTLQQALAAVASRPDEAWLRALLVPLLDALEYLHAASCYHRDISPDNILLLDGGRPLLLDFGAARRLIGDMSKSATVILKAGYAPIEQYGEIPGMSQGPWTDIYALGAVLHFAITGRKPMASVTRLLRDDGVPLATSAAGQYSDRLLHAVDRMLAVQPMQRPQSIAEVRALLDQPRAAQPPLWPAPAAKPAGRWVALVAAGAALLVVGATAAWLMLRVPEAAKPPAPTAGPAVRVLPAVPAPAPMAEPVPANVPAAEPAPAASATRLPPPVAPTPEAVAAEHAPAPAATEREPRPRASPTARPVRPAAASKPQPPLETPPPRMSARCTEIVQRISIGEVLTAAERAVLKEECRK